MTRIMDLRLPSSGGVIDAVRRVEYVALLLISACSLLLFSGYGAIIALPLALLALMLVPTTAKAASSREKQRLDTLNEIQTEGLQLRSRWLGLSERPLNSESAVERWDVRRETILWMYRSTRSLRSYPEVAGIFEAHEPRADLMEDLDSCLTTLSRLRRLVTLSENLKLPI